MRLMLSAMDPLKLAAYTPARHSFKDEVRQTYTTLRGCESFQEKRLSIAVRFEVGGNGRLFDGSSLYPYA